MSQQTPRTQNVNPQTTAGGHLPKHSFSIPETKATEIAKMVRRAFRVLHPKRITVHVNTGEQVRAVRKPVQNLDENITREMAVIWQEM